jgi:hypothetical protein
MFVGDSVGAREASGRGSKALQVRRQCVLVTALGT